MSGESIIFAPAFWTAISKSFAASLFFVFNVINTSSCVQSIELVRSMKVCQILWLTSCSSFWSIICGNSLINKSMLLTFLMRSEASSCVLRENVVGSSANSVTQNRVNDFYISAWHRKAPKGILPFSLVMGKSVLTTAMGALRCKYSTDVVKITAS